MQISLNQLTAMRWSMAEDALFCSTTGIQSIGLMAQKVESFGVEKTIELLRDLEIQVSSFGTIGFVSDITEASLDGQIHAAIKVIQRAAELSAGHVLMHTGGPGGHLKKNRFCVAHKVLDSLLPVAQEHGVKLAIESLRPDERTGKLFSHSFVDCVDLVNQYSSPDLGLNIDLYHVGNEWLEPGLNLNPRQIFQFQLSDFYQKNDRYYRCEMGTGELKILDLFNYLEQISFQHALEIELWGEAFDFQPYASVIQNSISIVNRLQVQRKTSFESLRV